MSLKVAISTADEHPLPSRWADQIWGINFVRTAQDAAAAPPDVADAFQKVTTTVLMTRCVCCGRTMSKTAGGLAVLRTHLPGLPEIITTLCRGCLREPDDNKLTPKIIRTLTGQIRPAIDWKKLLS